MDKKWFSLLLMIYLALVSAACSGEEIPPAPVLTPPAISLDLTGENCPSIEVQAGMQIAWTNRDDKDRVLWLEHEDENGVLIDAGGTDLLQPGTTFSITLTEPGQYTYYCTEDRATSGMITVLP